MLTHYIHCHQKYNPNKGGSVGYLSSLFDGFAQYNQNQITPQGIKCKFMFPNEDKINDILEKPTDNRFIYTQDYKIKTCTKNLLKQRQNWFKELIPQSEFDKIKTNEISSIHIHGAYNFLPIYNTLVKKGIESRVIKILTTHNPYQPTMEDMYLTCKTVKWRNDDKDMFFYYLNQRDRWAFTLADCLFFPSEESLEGYYNLWKDFKELTKNKNIYFCPTGTKTKNMFQDKDSLKAELNIPSEAKVFLYLGRFIDVRGYDILIKVAQKILAYNDDIYFLVVGEKGEQPIQSKQWIQIPYTQNPQDFINIADACLCPNRGSLFDLSMIEILSLKKPLICSYVGGYKWLENKTNGMLYAQSENVDSFVKAIEKFLTLSEYEKKIMSENNFNLYQRELTLEKFQKNYCETIDKIYQDFGISEKIYALSFSAKDHLFSLAKKEINANFAQTSKFKKLKKLFTKPHLFFIDFFKKRLKR
ncbi:glycosyltransferase [Helicobacter turcicus]|uniref:Glycosyltransferase n=1 Tax=Helicobacter turcicus TaxID=2867412 RepID=A0ABS7JQ76_9HELI|nr:glycosyltransferase [Helicobacter turcicus]MBX7491548.1 glycosyltransferase [Helicobacter turcicus]MBX7546403.1 glycosyltransferase [Helicobacter turcicus]